MRSDRGDRAVETDRELSVDVAVQRQRLCAGLVGDLEKVVTRRQDVRCRRAG
jgi:hypothetical protein